MSIIHIGILLFLTIVHLGYAGQESLSEDVLVDVAVHVLKSLSTKTLTLPQIPKDFPIDAIAVEDKNTGLDENTIHSALPGLMMRNHVRHSKQRYERHLLYQHKALEINKYAEQKRRARLRSKIKFQKLDS